MNILSREPGDHAGIPVDIFTGARVESVLVSIQPSLDIVGTRLTLDGLTLPALTFRMPKAWRTWHCHREYFCCQTDSIRDRLLAFRSEVAPALFSSGERALPNVLLAASGDLKVGACGDCFQSPLA